MEAQVPAEGILKRNDYGNSKWYQVACTCGDDAHNHTFEVEADVDGINVNIYANVTTNYWEETFKPNYNIKNHWMQEFDIAWKEVVNGLIRRVKLTYEVWTKGYVSTQTTLSMSKQQALNYASVLSSSIDDVEHFEQERQV